MPKRIRTFAPIALCVAGAIACGAVGSSLILSRAAGEGAEPTSGLRFPDEVDLGDLEAGETRFFDVEATNETDAPIPILGAFAHCSRHFCTDAVNLPLTVPPGESRAIRIKVRVGDSPGASGTDFLPIYTNRFGEQEVGLKFRGMIVAATESRSR